MSERTENNDFDPMLGANKAKKETDFATTEERAGENMNEEGAVSFASKKELENVLRKKIYKEGIFLRPGQVPFGGNEGRVISGKNDNEKAVKAAKSSVIPMSAYEENKKKPPEFPGDNEINNEFGIEEDN